MSSIKDMKQISTQKGDTGYTRNYSNKKLIKTNLLFHVLGDMDELSSSLGLAYHHSTMKDEIRIIQTVLQKINSVIATDDYSKLNEEFFVKESDLAWLETQSQSILNYTVIEPVFILPGSDTSLEGAYFDMARSITRRVERSLVSLHEDTNKEELLLSMKYLNRLSDYLFVVARYKK